MAQETNQTQVSLCVTGCGFYGNPQTNGMCSVCYKDFLQRKNSSDPVSNSFSASEETRTTPSPTVTPTSAQEENSTVTVEVTVQAEQTSGQAQAELKAEEAAGSLKGSFGSVKGLARRGKRKRDEKTELDKGSASGSGFPVQSSSSTSFNSKPKQKRCFTCHKKVGFTGFDCRCGNLFCGVHRYSDVHNCTYNYKAEAAEKIRKENPLIVGEKIQKI